MDREGHLLDGFGTSSPDEEQDLVLSRPASSFRPERITWLWDQRIAAGFLNVAAGLQGVGKSTILYDLAARVSRECGTVLVATAEDHIAAVVRPRLQAARADLDRVEIWVADLVLPAGRLALESRVREIGAALVIVDPLVAFLETGIDSHKDASVRQALRPLAEMAEATGCAVVTVLHLNKGSSDDPLMRVAGSSAFTAAARHVLLACGDPDDESGMRRVLAVVKSNLGPFPAPVTYTIESVPWTHDDGGQEFTSRVVWGSEVPHLDPRSLLRSPIDPEERSAIDEAKAFLRAELAAGPRSVAELKTAAARATISETTLKRAKRELGIRSLDIRDADNKIVAWRWDLPASEVHEPGDQPPRGPVGPVAPTSADGDAQGPRGQEDHA